MSFFNATTTVHTLTPLPKHITRSQVLSFLHDPQRMIHMNPIVKSVVPLPSASSTAFFASVPDSLKPTPTEGQEAPAIPVFEVVEDMSGESADAQAGNWRGGWAKRFIPDSLTYETSVEAREDGMRSLTHAAMGVSSVTHWTVKDGEEGGLAVEKVGSVTSNRMLMSFIRTTLEESHQKLATDFVAAVEKYVAELEEVEKVS